MQDSRKATCSSAVTFDMVGFVGFGLFRAWGVGGRCFGDGCG